MLYRPVAAVHPERKLVCRGRRVIQTVQFACLPQTRNMSFNRLIFFQMQKFNLSYIQVIAMVLAILKEGGALGTMPGPISFIFMQFSSKIQPIRIRH